MRYARSAVCWLLLALGAGGLKGVSGPRIAARAPSADRWYAITQEIQVERSCVDLGLKHLKGDREKLFSRLREWSEEALSRVAGCRERYPMLEPYLDQWDALARRIRIRCVDLPYEGMGGFAAFSHGSYFEMSRSALYGVLAGKGGYHSDKGTWNGKPYTNFAAWGNMVDLFIHEVFHGTETNNRLDHNQIEGVLPETHGPCGEDVRMDRVCVVSNLCSGVIDGPMGGLSVEEALFRRMSHCGRARGCEDLFTGKAGNYGLVSRLLSKKAPSADRLSARQARELCERIEDEGYCRHVVREQGATVIRADPRLSRYGRLLRERLEAVLPVSPNMVPIAYVEADPELAAGYARVRGYECFRGIFSTAPSGNLFANVPNVERVAYGERWERFARDGFMRHFARIFEGAEARVKDHVLCRDEERREEILDWVRRLVHAFNVVQYASTFRAVFARAMGLAESGIDVMAGAWREEHGFLDSQVRRLVGPKLLSDYQRALRQYHPDSPHFRCDDAWFARTRGRR